ncbi:MAG: hypothetical protein WAU32_15345 [Thermoanaerobaculia bacterium]
MLSRPAWAWLYAIVLTVLAAAAVRALIRAHEDRMRLSTGRAEWIWYTKHVPEPRPLAFVATRDFELVKAPERALAKLFVDRDHVLYVNGSRAGSGSQRPGDSLALYEVAPLLKPGINRVAIAAASPTGIGGILFSLDVFGMGRNAVVSDDRWRVDLTPEAVASGARYRPAVWGRPPQYPWRYPRMPEPRELENFKSQFSNKNFP